MYGWNWNAGISQKKFQQFENQHNLSPTQPLYIKLNLSPILNIYHTFSVPSPRHRMWSHCHALLLPEITRAWGLGLFRLWRAATGEKQRIHIRGTAAGTEEGGDRFRLCFCSMPSSCCCCFSKAGTRPRPAAPRPIMTKPSVASHTDMMTHTYNELNNTTSLMKISNNSETSWSEY